MQKLKIVWTRKPTELYAVGDIVYRRSCEGAAGIVWATHKEEEDLWESFLLYPEEFELVEDNIIAIQLDELACLLYPQAFSRAYRESAEASLCKQLARMLGNA